MVDRDDGDGGCGGGGSDRRVGWVASHPQANTAPTTRQHSTNQLEEVADGSSTSCAGTQGSHVTPLPPSSGEEPEHETFSELLHGLRTRHSTYIHTHTIGFSTYIHTYIQTYIHDNVVCRRAAAAEAPAEPAQQQQPEEEGTPDPEEEQQQQDADKEYGGPEVVFEYF